MCSRKSIAYGLPIGPPLTPHLSSTYGRNLQLVRPALGSALMWAEARATKIADIVLLQAHAASMLWHIACKKNNVHVRTKAAGDAEVRRT